MGGSSTAFRAGGRGLFFLPSRLPGPPKEPNIVAQYPKIESIGSVRSIILPIWEVQVERHASVSLYRLMLITTDHYRSQVISKNYMMIHYE